MIITALKVLNFVLFALYFPGSHLYVLATAIFFLLSLRGYRYTRIVRYDGFNTFERKPAVLRVLVKTPKYSLRDYAKYSEILGPIEYYTWFSEVDRPGMSDVGIQLHDAPTDWEHVQFADWYTPTFTIWCAVPAALVTIYYSAKFVVHAWVIGMKFGTKCVLILWDVLMCTINKPELKIAHLLENPIYPEDDPFDRQPLQHRVFEDFAVQVDEVDLHFALQVNMGIDNQVDEEVWLIEQEPLPEQEVLIPDQRGQFVRPRLLIMIFVMNVGALGEAPPNDRG